VEDPFNKFWGVVEPMVDKLSNSVVLTSANDNESSPVYYDTTNNQQETDRIQREMTSISESFFMAPSSKKESLVVVEDTQHKSPKEENEELKAQLSSLKNQINELEKVNYKKHGICDLFVIRNLLIALY
jgi:galactose-1-phosphate uridylyltransferase